MVALKCTRVLRSGFETLDLIKSFENLIPKKYKCYVRPSFSCQVTHKERIMIVKLLKKYFSHPFHNSPKLWQHIQSHFTRQILSVPMSPRTYIMKVFMLTTILEAKIRLKAFPGLFLAGCITPLKLNSIHFWLRILTTPDYTHFYKEPIRLAGFTLEENFWLTKEKNNLTKDYIFKT